MRNKILRLDNLGLGMRRDGVMKQEYMYSLYTMKNYEIDYTEGKLRIRKGYDRWNTVALSASATQLFWFNDMSGQEHLLAIIGNTWYKVHETSTHTQLSTYTATAHRPTLQFGSRAFLGTDKATAETTAGGNGVLWTDHTAIGTGTAYRMGIKPPNSSPTMYNATADGRTATADHTYEVNATDQRKISIPYIPTYNTMVGSIRISLFRHNTDYTTGNVRITIQTNSGGNASGTVVTNGTSDWVSVSKLTKGGSAWIKFNFPKIVELTASTTYHIVIEGDEAYYLFYAAIYIVAPGDFGVGVRMEGSPGSYTYGTAKKYNVATSTWTALSAEAMFYLSGLTETAIGQTGFYDYVITYYNSTYGIESRKSPYSRIKIAQYDVVYLANYPTPTDGQVDKIRIYRRKLASDATGIEEDADITEPYYFVYEVDAGFAFYDTLSDEYTLAEIQTNDHYCIDETDEEGTKLRESEIHPDVMALWKGRIWMAEADSNIIYMTKRLEEDGATGLTGAPIPDYVPLENKVIIESEGSVIGIKSLPSDELAIYMSDSTIWTLSGANMLLNPPPDMSLRRITSDMGLVASQGLTELRGRHLFMARTGIYAFTGLSTVEKLSGNIQSIFDDISNSYIDDSIFISFGDELWVLVDDDNDGALNSFFIMDLGRDPVTWRWYDYGVDLNDVIIRKTGADYNSILAADAGSKYILQLNNGTTDKGSAIVGEIQLHRIRGRNRMILTRVSIDAYYPSTAPTYAVTVIGPTGTEYAYTLSPSVSTDIRKHSVGVRVPADPEAWVKIQQTSGGQDEILSIEVEGTEL